jgi:hypothetical protein
MNWLARTTAAAVDSGPVLTLAVIAGTGSFTHIRDTAIEHGQSGPMAWAVAICIDLTCIMAARERQRDKRTGRRTRLVTWPTLVLAGGIVLSLAANLAQAEPSWWGRITAATPCGAFLVAVSMLERRNTDSEPAATPAVPAQDEGRTSHPAVPTVEEVVPDVPQVVLDVPPVPDEPVPSPVPDVATSNGAPAEALVAFARRVADEHHAKHGRPITRDTLRARLGVSNQLASDLLRHIRSAPQPDNA